MDAKNGVSVGAAVEKKKAKGKNSDSIETDLKHNLDDFLDECESLIDDEEVETPATHGKGSQLPPLRTNSYSQANHRSASN